MAQALPWPSGPPSAVARAQQVRSARAAASSEIPAKAGPTSLEQRHDLAPVVVGGYRTPASDTRSHTATYSGTDLVSLSDRAPVENPVGAVPVLGTVTVDLLSAGVPANTRRAYAADRAEWTAYAELRAAEPLPVCPDLLADYMATLLTVGSPTARVPRPLAATSVARRLSAISTLSVERGHGRPDLRAARLVLRGHRRTSAREARQAAPVTIPILRALVAEAAFVGRLLWHAPGCLAEGGRTDIRLCRVAAACRGADEAHYRRRGFCLVRSTSL